VFQVVHTSTVSLNCMSTPVDNCVERFRNVWIADSGLWTLANPAERDAKSVGVGGYGVRDGRASHGRVRAEMQFAATKGARAKSQEAQ